MAKNSPNKRKSQNHEVQTPKKQKANENNQKTPIQNKMKTPKGGKTPKSAKKNTQEEKLNKFSGTANLMEKEEDASLSGDESDYEVEQEVKPEKIGKTMNENTDDSEEADDDSDDVDVDNAVNENSENGDKKQNNKNKHAAKDIKEFIEKESAKGKMRYVLFIGNLPYSASVDDIKSHFKNGINIKSVRLPVGKGQDKKPRGFGYLEVDDKDSYLKALALHHTFLNGRRINVLYTAGGKKKSSKAKSIIKSKNFKLNALRKEGKLEFNKSDSQKRSVRRAIKRTSENKTE